MECGLGHFSSDTVQQVADILVCLLDAGEGNHFGESLSHLFVLQGTLNDLGVQAHCQE